MKKDKETSKKQERRLHYNRVAEIPPENIFSWYFLIVNKPGEMERIMQRLYEELKPVHEQMDFDMGIIGNSHGLNYRLLCLKSSVCNLDFSQVYNGKVLKDRRLYQRESGASLLNIIEQEGINHDFEKKDKPVSKKNNPNSNDEQFIDYTM